MDTTYFCNFKNKCSVFGILQLIQLDPYGLTRKFLSEYMNPDILKCGLGNHGNF